MIYHEEFKIGLLLQRLNQGVWPKRPNIIEPQSEENLAMQLQTAVKWNRSSQRLLEGNAPPRKKKKKKRALSQKRPVCSYQICQSDKLTSQGGVNKEAKSFTLTVLLPH